MFIFLCRFAPGGLTLRSTGLKKRKKAPGEKLPALTPVPDDAEYGRVSVCLARRNCQPANLRIIQRSLRRMFTQFKLCAHFLYAGGKGVDLLLLLRENRLEILALLFDFAVLFEEFIE